MGNNTCSCLTKPPTTPKAKRSLRHPSVTVEWMLEFDPDVEVYNLNPLYKDSFQKVLSSNTFSPKRSCSNGVRHRFSVEVANAGASGAAMPKRQPIRIPLPELHEMLSESLERTPGVVFSSDLDILWSILDVTFAQYKKQDGIGGVHLPVEKLLSKRNLSRCSMHTDCSYVVGAQQADEAGTPGCFRRRQTTLSLPACEYGPGSFEEGPKLLHAGDEPDSPGCFRRLTSPPCEYGPGSFEEGPTLLHADEEAGTPGCFRRLTSPPCEYGPGSFEEGPTLLHQGGRQLTAPASPTLEYGPGSFDQGPKLLQGMLSGKRSPLPNKLRSFTTTTCDSEMQPSIDKMTEGPNLTYFPRFTRGSSLGIK